MESISGGISQRYCGRSRILWSSGRVHRERGSGYRGESVAVDTLGNDNLWFSHLAWISITWRIPSRREWRQIRDLPFYSEQNRIGSFLIKDRHIYAILFCIKPHTLGRWHSSKRLSSDITITKLMLTWSVAKEVMAIVCLEVPSRIYVRRRVYNVEQWRTKC